MAGRHIKTFAGGRPLRFAAVRGRQQAGCRSHQHGAIVFGCVSRCCCCAHLGHVHPGRVVCV
eukprot:13668-Lingulodinium_polyedra.AAC.1